MRENLAGNRLHLYPEGQRLGAYRHRAATEYVTISAWPTEVLECNSGDS